ncbi:histidine kinase N-terminal 7TM domain-containing protein [Natrinema sp. SYSU A 869]|uniref:histidine kinase N-terminal 7TM domain-containing protein n=1 Tax=Natrinema sp. SYSU A 869 TaxID=2871694 RepID=UPI001CA457F2|nr:histidine kinase N-terminal 7TM domain-containing protein [Natrinema sp. SYSU A 869]
MELGFDPILAIYVFSVFFCGLLAVLLWKHRQQTGAVPLLANVLSSGVWAGSLALLRVVENPTIESVLTGTLFLGVGFGTMTVLVFTLSYTGRERFVRPTVLAALSVEPVLITVFAAVNPSGLFFRLTAEGFDGGFLFWLHLGYSYVVLGTVTAFIVGFLVRSRSLYRGQSGALLGGTLAAWLANGIYMAGIVDFDISPIGFVIGGALYAAAIVRYRLTDIVPIARDRVVENISDGIFVVDERDRVIDANPAGRSLLAADDASLIGSSIDSLFAERPELRDEVRELIDSSTKEECELGVAGSDYAIETTPIEDDRDHHVGWLFIVRDITERKQRETQLQRQNERLERFADVVSHDLRNPLNVADGYLELAREADDPEPSLDEIEESHDRMAAIIEDVLALARDGRSVTDPKPVSLADLAEGAWENVDTGDATLTVASGTTILADADRMTRLLENLFRNSIEHGMPDLERADEHRHSSVPDSAGVPVEYEAGDTPVANPTSPSLEVEVGSLAIGEGDGSAGFYVTDDGSGLPDGGDRVFEDGYTTTATGTGFGLSIVEGIATAHSWTVDASESERGGARFEFRSVETGAAGTTPDPAVGTTSDTDS